MKGNAKRFMHFNAGLVGLVTLAWALAGQGAKPAQHRAPLPTDWSHRHLIFSQPSTPQQRAQVESEPRYWQQSRRSSLRLAPPTHTGETSVLGRFGLSTAQRLQKNRRIHRDWAETMGLGAKVGAGNFPAKLTFDITTASCDSDPQPDFVVFSTGLQSAAGTQASIVAFDNLYSGCTGTVPLPYWAYDTTIPGAGGAPGTIKTSPVPSLDGSQIAFVQTDGVGHATLVLLRWAATGETFDIPGTPAFVAPGSYLGCGAPCMTSFDLKSGVNTQTDDTTSSVFYDYTGDIAWVGDSQGWLHKFTGVFLGTPAEVRTGGFPVQMPAGTVALSSPVFDRISQTVFVGDQSGVLNRVDATTAAVTSSGQLDFGTGIVDAPMVDVTRGQVYVSSSDDGSGGCAGGADCAAVVQLSASFAAGDTGTGTATVGIATFTGTPLPNPLYDGTVDNAFLNSANATGNLYVCGNTGANPTLYVVPILAGNLGTPAVLSTLATNGSNPACSPVTDISAPGATAGSAATEHLFVSVQNNSTACGGGGCIQNLIDTPWQASASFTVGQEILVKGSSSAVRYINVVITAGTSGTTQPSWPSTAGVTRTDGSVVWLNQGNTTTPINPWQSSHSYTVVGGRILDSNGNVQVIRTTVAPHLSGGTAPTWNTTPGGFTADNNINWVNAGALPTAALASTGGTSGIIIDNTVDPGSFAGASQIYFSTLVDQTCATSGGTGGCAVQASQSALQ